MKLGSKYDLLDTLPPPPPQFEIQINWSKYLQTEPEAHGPQRSPECMAMMAIFSQNIVNDACKKI